MARAFSSQAGGTEPGAAPSDNSEGRVAVRCFPASDGQFGEYVEAVVAEALAVARNSEALLAEVRGALVARYPHVAIYPRDELAELGPQQAPTWYVFRDGRAS
jgi:hypothetical protein